MRTGNPSLRRIFRQSQTGEIHVESQPATYWGIAKKAMLFGGITILSAIAVLVALNFAFYGNNPEVLTVVLIGVLCGALPMIIISLVITFVPKTVKFLGPVYTLFQGATLGMLVFSVDLAYPGIALAAVLGTLIVFVLCVALNKLLEVKEKFLNNGAERAVHAGVLVDTAGNKRGVHNLRHDTAYVGFADCGRHSAVGRGQKARVDGGFFHRRHAGVSVRGNSGITAEAACHIREAQ